MIRILHPLFAAGARVVAELAVAQIREQKPPLARWLRE